MPNPKASTFATTFPGTSLPAGISPTGNPTEVVTVAGGQVVIAHDAAFEGSISLDAAYDLTDDELFVVMGDTWAEGQAIRIYVLNNTGLATLSFGVAGPSATEVTLYASDDTDTFVDHVTEPLDASAYRAYAVGVLANGDVRFRASNDGGNTWTMVLTATPPNPADWTDVFIEPLLCDSGVTGSASLAAYNVATPAPPAFTATVRETTLGVTATPSGGTSPDDDVAIDQALAARCTFGFDQPVSEALVPVPEMPAGVAYGDTLTIKFGVVGSGNETAVRFKGTLEERRYDLYPRTVTLVGKGPLWKAQQYQNWEDPGDNGGLTIDDLMGYRVFTANAGTDVITATGHTYSDGDVVIVKTGASGAVLPAPLATYVKYFVRDSATDTFKLAATSGGSAINLTTAGSGTLWVETAPTDEALVMAVLDRCGVAYDPALIGGTGQLWGAQNDDELLWKTGEAATGTNLFAGPGQSGLNWILALDAVSAVVFDAGASGGFYRTFDGPAGKVRRLLIGGRPRNAVDFTFEEGVNIWQGSAVRSVLEQKNGVVVHGWDSGSGGASEAVAPSGLVPSTSTRVYSFSHPLIEFDDAADRTAQGYEDYVGMDCETVGLAILLEVDRETVEVQLATPEDWLLCPGQTHLVQGPGGAADRLGTGEVLWCKSLTAECDERGAITQHPGEIGGGIDVPADGDPNLDEVPFA